jgi:dolichol-phosphate mannosyltransferase
MIPALLDVSDVPALLELAVVIPTFNEKANVPTLIAKLDQALAGRRWEAIFVDDDSPDGTADAARELGRIDTRVRVIQRIGRRGLSSACIEGMCATAAPVVAVIDGDLQHDETLLPAMLDLLQAGEHDVVIGSRFVSGGGTGDWDRDRVAKSALATRLSRRVLKADLSDPMSGFFMIRARIVRDLAPHLAAIGFKILLDIMTGSPRPLKFVELPYTFRTRTEGESKLDHVVALEFLIALYDRMFGRIVPVRFAMFSAIGLIGVGVHMGVLTPILLGWGDRAFLLGQVIAAVVAMTVNFSLNNALTYRDRRLRGWRQLLDGWVSFCVVCSVGLVANVGVAGFLHEAREGTWATAALLGVLVGAVWNYALSSRFTWGRY